MPRVQGLFFAQKYDVNGLGAMNNNPPSPFLSGNSEERLGVSRSPKYHHL